MPKDQTELSDAIKLAKIEHTYIINFDASIFSEILEFVKQDFKNLSRQITILGCDGGFSKCIPKQNWTHLTTEDACDACKTCQLKQDVTNRKIDFPKYYLERNFLPTEVEEFLNSDPIEMKHYLDFEYEGIHIFRLVAFDLVSQARSLNPFELFSGENLDFRLRLLDVCNLINWLKLSINFDRSTLLLACNGNYMLNSVCREIARLNNGHFLSVEMEPIQNTGYRRFKYFEGRDAINSKSRSWNNYLGYSFRRRNFSKVLKQFENRFKGNAHNSYVIKKDDLDTREKIENLRKRTNSIRSVFLSSSEELLAHAIAFDHNFSFEYYVNHQTNFLRYLIEEAANFPEIGIVVRCHPRQGISKKSSVISEEYRVIQMLIDSSELPENILFIEPSDLISSYKVIALSQAVYIFWSTIGLESILLGTPTITLAPEIEIWPLKELTNCQFENSEVAWSSIFSDTVSVGLPSNQCVIEWYERTFYGNWYQTCIPILTSSTLLRPRNLVWRVIDKYGFRKLVVKKWIQIFSTDKALNERYRTRSRWSFLEIFLRRMSYLELIRWRDHWHRELVGKNQDIN